MEPESEQGRRDRGETMEEEQQDDLVQLLPDDALADVLRRLAPRDLAASRCVRRAWLAIIDDRKLLLPDLLPHAVGGIFIDFNSLESWEFFARPTTGPSISGELDFLPQYNPHYGPYVQDHCNGLLLCDHYVVNPATQRYAPVPPRPASCDESKMSYFDYDEYLVFDPYVSPHYEVFRIPRIMYKYEPGNSLYSHPHDELDPIVEESEWPPSPWVLDVFSSKTGEWEQRLFSRKGEAAGTVSDMRKALLGQQLHGTYWNGALYVQHESDFATKISLSNNKYQVIKPPVGIRKDIFSLGYLGKSKTGVYCACTSDRQLHVWILKELCGQMEWVMMHQTNLESILACRKPNDGQINRPWILRDINYRRYRRHDEDDSEDEDAVVQEKCEWNSDDDNVLLQAERNVDGYHGYIDIDVLGFHPYKEVVYLNYAHIAGHCQLIYESFPFTPCWMEECPP
ncbi:hypothetical protein ACP70R_025142 [Stipagrostis hirtigluma subsp. patula]